jgi:hypothetical protein
MPQGSNESSAPPQSSPKKFFEPPNTPNTRKIQTFPPELSGFAYFAYFAVDSLFYIGTGFEVPYFTRSLVEFAFVSRAFGAARFGPIRW